MKREIEVRVEEDFLGAMKKLIDDPVALESEPNHVISIPSFELFHKIFSPARLKLLSFLSRNRDKEFSVGELSDLLERKQEAISRDLLHLEGLVKLERKGRKTIPKCDFSVIRFNLSPSSGSKRSERHGRVAGLLQGKG